MITKERVIVEINRHERICPLPGKWNELYELLLVKKSEVDGKELPPPLILAAWWNSPVFEKKGRLIEQIQWADDHGFLSEVFIFLASLPESDWYHKGD